MVLIKELELPEELLKLSNEEFDCGWTDGKVSIKRFKFGETNSISRESTKIRATNVGGKMNMDVDVNPEELQVLTLLKGVTKAPWKVNDVTAVNELPPPVANWVIAELDKFNTLTFKKKEG